VVNRDTRGDICSSPAKVARPFEGRRRDSGKDEYEQSKQIFSRIDRIIKAAGTMGSTIYVVDIENNTEVWASAP